jgi:hypothetical protein
MRLDADTDCNMLYSYKNRYPSTLPFRIVLPNGQTRTDPSTFTEEEITQAGFVAVSNPPNYNPSYQKLFWGGTDWIVEEISVEDHREKRKAELKDRRYQEEISHPTIDTTRESQAMINGIWSAFQINPNLTINYKGRDGWYVIDAAMGNAIAQQVVAHVQACFDNERVLSELLDATTTHEEVLAVNFSIGWPSY